ncbi:MAG: radical SAM family heme chaperone HemW [Candidatus Zixiibacteriota bacterium]|nr:MAG: radical SAM family heme chaperone HemW [candidate division Zixibacteria bacterium]
MAFSLYLHYPFCPSYCSYCDYCRRLHDRSLESDFYDALDTETRLAADWIRSHGARLNTIFVGGGTPSLTDLERFARWLEVLRSLFDIPDDIEFSFETNPESVALANLSALKNLGVNRPVFGIQSFNTRLLERLGRIHTPHDSQRAVYYAGALGYRNFGVDLLFNLPGQTSRMLSDDLDQIIDLDPPHVSFYQLAVEEGTPLTDDLKRGRLRLPDRQLVLAMYRAGCQRLTEAGYVRYEVSSFAKPGFECRHNLGYWQGDEYLGLGPSAQSYVGGQRFSNHPDLDRYIQELKGNALPRVPDESGVEDRMTEAIMLGLRTSQGISRAQFSRRFGVPLETRLNRQQYETFIRSGHLLPDKGKLRLSDDAILRIDEITRRLLE